MNQICFVTYHTCSRAMKEYIALLSSGHPVTICQKVVTDEEMLYRQVFSCFYRDREHLRGKLIAFKDATLFHVHNEPNWPILEVKNAYPNTPVILLYANNGGTQGLTQAQSAEGGYERRRVCPWLPDFRRSRLRSRTFGIHPR